MKSSEEGQSSSLRRIDIFIYLFISFHIFNNNRFMCNIFLVFFFFQYSFHLKWVKSRIKSPTTLNTYTSAKWCSKVCIVIRRYNFELLFFFFTYDKCNIQNKGVRYIKYYSCVIKLRRKERKCKQKMTSMLKQFIWFAISEAGFPQQCCEIFVFLCRKIIFKRKDISFLNRATKKKLRLVVKTLNFSKIIFEIFLPYREKKKLLISCQSTF